MGIVPSACHGPQPGSLSQACSRDVEVRVRQVRSDLGVEERVEHALAFPLLA
jgi:hypothetical protein